MTKFDLNQKIEEYECASWDKKGMMHYFTANNIKITNNKDFEKAVKDYFKINVGE